MKIIEKRVNRLYILQMRSLFSETKDEFYQTLNEYSIKGLRKFSINKYISNSSINPITILWKS